MIGGVIILLLFGLLTPLFGASGPFDAIETEEILVDADTEGIDLFIRIKKSKLKKDYQSPLVLCVHGATYPAETSFDLQLDGFSWLDYMADKGYIAAILDIRGYGRSTRPPEMEASPALHSPIVDTAVAVRDVTSAANYLLRKFEKERLNLIGWSWGTAIMAGYAAKNQEKVSKLVLYAPIWHRQTPSLISTNKSLGSYRLVSKEDALSRWSSGLSEDQKKEILNPTWQQIWAEATWRTDPLAMSEGFLRAPNGVIKDGREYWQLGLSTYEPASIVCPTLLVVAQYDKDTPPYMAKALYDKLSNSNRRSLKILDTGTHTVMLEKNRLELFEAVDSFMSQ